MAVRRSTRRPSTTRPRQPATPRPPADAVQNHLLAALPRADYDRLRPSFDVVPLKLKAVLHKPGEDAQHVYFPGGGFCSIVTVLRDGSMVEVATVGREGMLGVGVMPDGTPSPSATMVQA